MSTSEPHLRSHLPVDALGGDARAVDWRLRGAQPAPDWVAPTLVATLLLGLALLLIERGFCFSCAAKAQPLWPLATIALGLAYLRGFELRVHHDEVQVRQTLLGIPWRIHRAPLARVSPVPDGPTARHAMSITLLGPQTRVFFLGQRRHADAWVREVKATLKAHRRWPRDDDEI